VQQEDGEGRRQAVDLFDSEGHVTVFSGEWIDSPPVRGTGCMLSAAIAACLARGLNLEESVSAGKEFVTETIRRVATTTAVTL